MFEALSVAYSTFLWKMFKVEYFYISCVEGCIIAALPSADMVGERISDVLHCRLNAPTHF